MKPQHRSSDIDELIALQHELYSAHSECSEMREAYDAKRSTIMEQIDALTLRRINTFPCNVPCTLGKLSNMVDVSMEQVEHHMIRTIPSNRMYERSMYDLVDIIDTITPNRIYTGLTGIYVVMQPNWIFARLCDNNNVLIERIE